MRQVRSIPSTGTRPLTTSRVWSYSGMASVRESLLIEAPERMQNHAAGGERHPRSVINAWTARLVRESACLEACRVHAAALILAPLGDCEREQRQPAEEEEYRGEGHQRGAAVSHRHQIATESRPCDRPDSSQAQCPAGAHRTHIGRIDRSAERVQADLSAEHANAAD